MAQEMTLGCGKRLEERVRSAAENHALSHAIILSGHGDLPAAARFVAAAMECTGAHRPCGVCPACRKVERDIHPDVITVTDPEHKNLSMDTLRAMRSDAYIIPNEGARKVYIFPDCAKLDPKGQNILLKVLEEGPPHAAFLFCAENSAVLLQTIRSRAVEWKLTGGEEVPASGREDAERLCLLLGEGKAADLAAYCAELENSKIGREELAALLSAGRDIMTEALAASYGTPSPSPTARRLSSSMSRRRITDAIALLEQFTRECGYNIGVGHLTGTLSASWEYR